MQVNVNEAKDDDEEDIESFGLSLGIYRLGINGDGQSSGNLITWGFLKSDLHYCEMA